MKDKEKLLSMDNSLRFIFSHSALREGWDNPNVFKICTLKQSGSDVRKFCLQAFGKRIIAFAGNDGEYIDVMHIVPKHIGIHPLATLINTKAQAPSNFLTLADTEKALDLVRGHLFRTKAQPQPAPDIPKRLGGGSSRAAPAVSQPGRDSCLFPFHRQNLCV